MTFAMPEPDAATLSKRSRIVAAMRAILPGESVIDCSDDLRPRGIRRPRCLPPNTDARRPARDGGAVFRIVERRSNGTPDWRRRGTSFSDMMLC